MVTLDEETLKNYKSNLRYRMVEPSLEQRKNDVIAIYDDLETHNTPNSTYRYIVVYKDSLGNLFQDFVDVATDGNIRTFCPYELQHTM